MKNGFLNIARLSHEAIARAYLRIFREKNSLITVLFHGLFRNNAEIVLNLVDPLEKITVEHFRRFVEYFLNHDYNFISPDDISNGLNNHKKYLLVTFDDGYFNNHLALPVLKEYEVPAVFFISTDHIKYNTCFWWDVLYRERSRQGANAAKIHSEADQLKCKTTDEIENHIKGIFGEKSFHPQSDIDRPFTVSELKKFADEKYVCLGNHTGRHAILTNYSPEGIKGEIRRCQKTIFDWTGAKPTIISYPNGNHSDEIVRISEESGLRLGLTVIPKKNLLPINHGTNDCMRLGRFILKGDSNITKQCDLIRSDLLLAERLKSIFGRGY